MNCGGSAKTCAPGNRWHGSSGNYACVAPTTVVSMVSVVPPVRKLLRHGGEAHPQVAHRQPRLRCTHRPRTHRNVRGTGDSDLATVAAQQVVHPVTGAPPREARTRQDPRRFWHQQEATLGRASVQPSISRLDCTISPTRSKKQRAVGRIQTSCPDTSGVRSTGVSVTLTDLLYIRVRSSTRFRRTPGRWMPRAQSPWHPPQGQRAVRLVAHLQRGDRHHAPRDGRSARIVGWRSCARSIIRTLRLSDWPVEVAHQWREVRRGGHRIGFTPSVTAWLKAVTCGCSSHARAAASSDTGHSSTAQQGCRCGAHCPSFCWRSFEPELRLEKRCGSSGTRFSHASTASLAPALVLRASACTTAHPVASCRCVARPARSLRRCMSEAARHRVAACAGGRRCPGGVRGGGCALRRLRS